MNDELVKRYTRQMILPDIGLDGQHALQEAHVFIIGLGGLGSPAAIYLAAAGIGQLSVCDYDRVDLSNLHRQILFSDKDVGRKKTDCATKKLQQINPALKINSFNHRLSNHELIKHCTDVDVVLDCSDNFATRHAVNKACVQNQIPLVSGAAIRLEGQIAVFNRKKQSPCYACLYPEGEEETQTCSETGVLGPLVGIIGSMQAMEAIKHITATGECLDGRLLRFDAGTMLWRNTKLKKDPHCAVCSQQQANVE